MARKAPPLRLTAGEVRSLTKLWRGGKTPARTQTRARTLDLLHRGRHPDAIAATLQVTTATVYNIKRRHLASGLDAALYDRAGAGRPVEIGGAQRAKITALACSQPPTGRARWSLRLLADKAVELGLCEAISHNAVKELLKKKPRPHLKKQRRLGPITAEYLARMEDLLHLYGLPYDEKRPVICFDELPVQLLGEVVAPLPMKSGPASPRSLTCTTPPTRPPPSSAVGSTPRRRRCASRRCPPPPRAAAPRRTF
jgi:transposase